ncbi:MAG TPA: hypothetical protein VGF00_01720 [Acidimicrobiia bacterium]
MHRTIRRTAALLALAALPALSACSNGSGEVAKIQPAKVVKIEGTDTQRVELTEKAAQRLGIETTTVKEATGQRAGHTVVPYAAVIYDADGLASVYTNPAPLSFVRKPVTVGTIEGDSVYLTNGPPVGTTVVTVGTAELFGTETGIGEFE